MLETDGEVIAFSDDNRVVLRIEDGKYKLTGGKPENAETFEEILITGGIN